ncbi:hypothetical protein M422DRAFT_782910 [Sphaerobolus stellatus SS14]|uniref:NmrA-like domain-containing protein n=1 Tax=Sphaerobolus stellatus (strain SS14) TaxID=990650 RepID=A0A0C9VAA2_SPHS4|nr:hypothetical protein M422DRAFT_782910 [Sphaerobolus stellatus SS14]
MNSKSTIAFTTVGRTSRYAISHFLASSDCPNIRVLIPSTANIRETFPAKLRSSPHSLLVVNRSDGNSLVAALSGVDFILHDGLAVHPREEAMGALMVEAARAAKVRHFIFISVLHPLRIKLPTHKLKLGIEEYIVESRLDYTILQPPHFMQNVDLDIAQKGQLPIGFSSTIEHGFLDMLDLITVILKIISNPSAHAMARYELVAENICYEKIAGVLGDVLGREVKCNVMPAKQFLARMNDLGEIKSEYAEDAILRLMQYYDRWGLVGNPNILQWLLEREPVTWETYARRELKQ